MRGGDSVNWTRPRFDPGERVWKSEMEPEEGGEKVVLKTRFAEDHFWITDEDAARTTTLAVHYYVNLEQPLKLVGLINDKMHGYNKVIVEVDPSATSLQDRGRFVMVCKDAGLWSELIRVGVGSWIKVYNVSFVANEGLIILSKDSRVRKVLENRK